MITGWRVIKTYTAIFDKKLNFVFDTKSFNIKAY